MLRVLQDKDEISQAQAEFIKKIEKNADETGKIYVGFQGGNILCNASWNKELDIWWVQEPISNRFWNCFGIGKPDWNSGYAHIIVCEINPPFEGIQRRIAGAFAIDEDGKLFILHRGKIGGGRKGIGKDLFLNNYRGKFIDVKDDNQVSNLALVASFENPRFLSQIANFVREIKRIKASVSANEGTFLHPKNDLNSKFNKEFSGKKKLNSSSKEIEAKCDHGLIVNSLANEFNNNGITAGNSVEIDLYTLDSKNNPKTLFEIKTDTSTSSIYKAIGQLYFSSTRLNLNCTLVAVFPKTIDKDSKKILKQLDIKCINYDWIDNKPKFSKFNPSDYA